MIWGVVDVHDVGRIQGGEELRAAVVTTRQGKAVCVRTSGGSFTGKEPK